MSVETFFKTQTGDEVWDILFISEFCQFSASFQSCVASASAPAGFAGSAGMSPAGSAGSDVRASACAEDALPLPSVELVHKLRDLVASSRQPRPAGDFGHLARAFTADEEKILQFHEADLWKRYVQSGKARRKADAKRRKADNQWVQTTTDRIACLSAQSKSAARPKHAAPAEPTRLRERKSCDWCLCADEVSLCAICNYNLCVECRGNHDCHPNYDPKPECMNRASIILSFSTDFEALRCVRTCKAIGRNLAPSLLSVGLLDHRLPSSNASPSSPC